MTAGAPRRADFADALTAAADQRLQRQRRRQLEPLRWLADGRVERDGRPSFDFCSNDYLGLARDPQQAAELAAAASVHGAGAGSAHAICGHHAEHQRLEAELADWLGRPRALLFSSGWSAALGTLDGILGRHDLCVQDRLNHACLLDGARLAQARLQRYAHADAKAAGECLKGDAQGRALLVTDGVFSMDGDLAPLSELARLCTEQRSWLMVDEAHALGVLGPQGRGSAAQARLDSEQVQVLMGTFGKAFGAFGAFVAGSEMLIEALIHQARPHLFTTALPPAWAQCVRAALRRIRDGEDLREALDLRIARWRQRVATLGLQLLPSSGAIQVLVLGEESRALAWQSALQDAGFMVKAIRPPTVPQGSARLRITLNVRQPLSAIDALAEQLARLAERDQATAHGSARVS